MASFLLRTNSKIYWWMLLALVAFIFMGGATALYFSQSAPSSNQDSTSAGESYSAGPFSVQVASEPNPPREGANQFTFKIYTGAGEPVSGAEIHAVAEMAAMGTMPAMPVAADIHSAAPGIYRADMELPMSGEWPLTLTIATPQGERGKLVLEMATGRTDFRPANPSTVNTDSNLENNEETFYIDTRRRQLIGVTLGHAERKQVNYTVRAAGRVASDERRLSDVALKFNGWIGTLGANYVGVPVRKGKPLFTVFSPELLNAQLEYLNVYRTRDQHDAAYGLLGAAHQRLLLWDMKAEQIRDLEARNTPLEYLPIMSPVDGIVMEKMIVSGSAFNAGDKLLRIADLSRVWVEAQAYQFELPLLKIGTPAQITFPDDSKRVLHGVVSYVAPFLDGDTRSARIRVELDNTDGALRPDMYTEVQLAVPLGQRLVVPEEAVLYSGANRVVFLDLGDGRLQPRRVHIGLRNNGWIEILDGLKSGDAIVTSGNFLISSETKLKGGLDQW